jgi:hypothetical protein
MYIYTYIYIYIYTHINIYTRGVVHCTIERRSKVVSGVICTGFFAIAIAWVEAIYKTFSRTSKAAHTITVG